MCGKLVDIPTCTLESLGDGGMSEAGDGYGVIGSFGFVDSIFLLGVTV